MNFEEALLEKRKGKEIRRKVWDKHVCWTAELDGLTYESIMADDWEIYEEPKWEPEGGNGSLPLGVAYPLSGQF